MDDLEQERNVESVYTITLNRKNLNTLLNHFTDCGLVETVVDSSGEISFKIPKNSSLDIKTINIIQELNKQVLFLDKKCKKTDKGSVEYNKILQKIARIDVTIEVFMELINKKVFDL